LEDIAQAKEDRDHDDEGEVRIHAHLTQAIGQKHSHHEKRGMGEVDHPHNSKDQSKAKGYEAVNASH
jgi:hypothetical protein